MSQWLNAFLIVVMLVAVWPSVLYFVREFVLPIKSVKFLRPTRKAYNRPLHSAETPMCMAKLIMLRHRIQQANARHSAQRLLPVTRPNAHIHGHSRHRPGWMYQTKYAARDPRWVAYAR